MNLSYIFQRAIERASPWDLMNTGIEVSPSIMSFVIAVNPQAYVGVSGYNRRWIMLSDRDFDLEVRENPDLTDDQANIHCQGRDVFKVNLCDSELERRNLLAKASEYA